MERCQDFLETRSSNAAWPSDNILDRIYWSYGREMPVLAAHTCDFIPDRDSYTCIYCLKAKVLEPIHVVLPFEILRVIIGPNLAVNHSLRNSFVNEVALEFLTHKITKREIKRAKKERYGVYLVYENLNSSIVLDKPDAIEVVGPAVEYLSLCFRNNCLISSYVSDVGNYSSEYFLSYTAYQDIIKRRCEEIETKLHYKIDDKTVNDLLSKELTKNLNKDKYFVAFYLTAWAVDKKLEKIDVELIEDKELIDKVIDDIIARLRPLIS